MTHNFERLKAHILPLSSSSDFQIARTEWDLVAVEICEELDAACRSAALGHPLLRLRSDRR